MDRSESTNSQAKPAESKPAQSKREDSVVFEPATVQACQQDYANARSRRNSVSAQTDGENS